MTNKELIKAAAESIGLKFGGAFNPLVDNSDAFMLMVKLGLTVGVIGDDTVTAKAGDVVLFEPLGTDRIAATRRVIVRAAAELRGL